MKILNIRTICLLLTFCCVAYNSYSVTDTLNGKKPIAVLLQLPSEHNRIEALTKDRRYSDLDQVIKDAIGVKTAMINDFTDNYDQCPVYYYMDTNAYLIQKKQFAGILLDKDGNPKKNIIIDSTTTNYLIAYYGYPLDGPMNEEDDKDKDPHTAYIIVMGRGLIILNSNFKQVHYFLKRGYDNLFINFHIQKKYYYFSKKFDIEYYPFAGHFSKSNLDRYGKSIKDDQSK